MKSIYRLITISICLLVPLHVSSETPNEIVMFTTDQVLEQLTINRPRLEADPGSIQQVVHEIIVPHFDFEKMSELVMGNNWSSLNTKQQTCFISGFRDLLVERYAYILLSYNNQNIIYDEVEQLSNEGYMLVTQTVSRDGAIPLPIQYAMHEAEEDWLVTDLIIDGVSLVRNYRGMFQSQIHLQGIDYFINNFPVCNSI